MKMYKCSECGHIFEKEKLSSWIEPYGEELSGCPKCISAVDEVCECKLCGSYSCENENDYCDECRQKTIKTFNKLMEEFFDDDEIEILKDEEVFEIL